MVNHNTVLIFVYGTLMSGQRAAGYMDGCTLLGRYCLRDYAMYDLGSYPGIVPQAGETVVGEVYCVPAERLPEMDEYEGEGQLYHRRAVTVERGGERVRAQAYVYAHREALAARKPMRMPWGSRGDDRVWYACYGSNLGEERFRLYIEGGDLAANGKHYDGCADKTRWTDSRLRDYPGGVYFGRSSGSWFGAGVAFYDPELPGKTHMRLYNISRAQLLDVQRQEGRSPDWYGRLITLGVDENGREICTFTAETPQTRNAPSGEYYYLIRRALIDECGLAPDAADAYLARCMEN